MVLAVLMVFAIASLTLDVGLWYTAHRKAQTQVDAAAQAGALAAGNLANVPASVNTALAANGSSFSASSGSCSSGAMTGTATGARYVVNSSDPNNPTVHVCIR